MALVEVCAGWYAQHELRVLGTWCGRGPAELGLPCGEGVGGLHSALGDVEGQQLHVAARRTDPGNELAHMMVAAGSGDVATVGWGCQLSHC